MEPTNTHTPDTVNRLGHFLLDVGNMLMSSGANTSRIRTTLDRIAGAFDCHIDLLITHRALMLTISDDAGEHFFSRLKRTSPHGVNFKIVSGISRMSWHALDDHWTLEQLEAELIRLQQVPHYRRWQILLAVSAAGAAFCGLFGGQAVGMAVAFAATFAGLFVRQEAVRLRFNPYLCIFLAAAVSSLLAGLSVKFQWGQNPEAALATSVLYLVPGVPLINCFSDLIDGNIMIGIVRGMNGLMISFAIAAGLLVAFMAYNI